LSRPTWFSRPCGSKEVQTLMQLWSAPPGKAITGLLSCAGYARLLPGIGQEVSQVLLWAQVVTHKELTGDEVRPLDDAAWAQRCQQLRQLGWKYEP
jgi:hypothetical protein